MATGNIEKLTSKQTNEGEGGVMGERNKNTLVVGKWQPKLMIIENEKKYFK